MSTVCVKRVLILLEVEFFMSVCQNLRPSTIFTADLEKYFWRNGHPDLDVAMQLHPRSGGKDLEQT